MVHNVQYMHTEYDPTTNSVTSHQLGSMLGVLSQKAKHPGTTVVFIFTTIHVLVSVILIGMALMPIACVCS